MNEVITFVSAGAPRHGKNLQTQVQEISDVEGWGWETRFVDWDYSGGWGYKDLDLGAKEWLWSVGQFGNVFQWMSQLECKKIAHWIGTDILEHRSIVSQGIYDPFDAADIHIADAPHLCDEAKELTNTEISYVRTVPPRTYGPRPIRRWTDVLCYVPTGREDFFRYSWIREIAGDYPRLTFHVLAREHDDRKGNIVEHEEISDTDKGRLWEQCFLFLRPCVHDGVSLLLVEMAQLGRHIIHSEKRIPYVQHGPSVGAIEFLIDTILDKREAPDPEASRFYRREYSRARLREDLERLKDRMEDV